MSVISLKKSDCKNCYKCLKVCPVKSITFENDQAEIMPHECILCGKCLEACPQNAKTIHSEIDTVQQFIDSGAKVVVSLAPSFIGSFDYKEPGQVVTALKCLGFTEVRETAEGAALVTDAYNRFLESNPQGTLLTTCCPTVNNLVERYFPELIPHMFPVLTPMIAHGRLIKEQYGSDAKVVFIGPCIAKKAEATDVMHDREIDAVLTFDEVNKWIESKGIDLKQLEPSSFGGNSAGINRMYPITDGVLASMRENGSLDGYNVMTIDGVEECIDLMKALKEQEMERTIIEINACEGGCINGPVVHGDKGKRFQANIDIKNYVKENGVKYPQIETAISMDKKFIDKTRKADIPSEVTIRSILSKIGKDSPEQERNCGFCGYPSCRDKAIAVYQKKAKLYMCLPYMSEMSQSLSNIILAETPNVIIAVDSEMKICELNIAAEKAFQTTRSKAIGHYLFEFIDSSYFELVLETHENIIDKKVEYPHYNLVTLQNITYVPAQKIVIGIFKDITQEEQKEEKMYQLRVDTVDMAQKVIDNQMRVAQQIASLLGETTAETKVTLTKLKDMIVYDDEVGK